jgi:probable DNA metabolism protein
VIDAADGVPASLDRWRADARRCLAAQLAPDALTWDDVGAASQLFGMTIPTSGGVPSHARVPKRFMLLAASVACHRDEQRWALLYDALWRLTHGEPHLLEVASDPLMHRLIRMHRGVRRASHKMKAFVRFRAVPAPDGNDPEFVAWFEPAHRVVERTAPFFVERFPAMRWSIFTPDGCARWNGDSLQLTRGIERHEVPADEDALEELWRTYYAGTFNPARLNRSAMLAEMPVRYWKHMPETRLIADLTRSAPARVSAMIAQTLAEPVPLPADLDALESATVPVQSPPTFDTWHPLYDPGWQIARQRAASTSVAVRADIPMTVAGTPLRVGVAGWTDPTLLAPDVFYPRDATTPEARLRFYASRLSLVEVDATYYAMPSAETARRWVERTPPHFRFDVKAHALMTGHPTDPRRLPPWLADDLPIRLRAARNVYTHHFSREAINEVWRRFVAALEPLREAGRLGAIMLQFPRWFTPTRESAAWLHVARDRLGDCPASVELRHRDWLGERIAPRTMALLRELAFSWVAVDAPPGMESSMPPTMAVTNPALAIIRLHGRRTSTWETRNAIVTERYRYLYEPAQLEAWLPSVYRAAFEAHEVHLVFNNNHANYATTNALEMADLVATASPRSLDVGARSDHREAGDDPRPTSRDSAPAGVVCEAKEGTPPDWYR